MMKNIFYAIILITLTISNAYATGTNDDHGDTTATATAVATTSQTAGVIGVIGDIDVFKIVLASAGTLTVKTTGTTDTYGTLLNSNGSTLQTHDDILWPSNPNFLLSMHLAAGTYYVKVEYFPFVHYLGWTGVGGYSLGSAFTPDQTPGIHVPALSDTDFNGDARDDILWHHSLNGLNAIWSLNANASVAGQLTTALPDQNWEVSGIADFNGDGNSDILWHHATTGANVIWFMNGSAVLPLSGSITTLADTNWIIAATGDFNGDGRADILWRHVLTGQNVIWLMNGKSVLAGSGSTTALSNAAWVVAASGDFNRDGFTDLLWRNSASGQNVVWFMSGTRILAGSGSTTSLADQNWHVSAAGDFNGDSSQDLVWRHRLSGQNVIWLMNGRGILAGSGPTTGLPNNSWQIAGTGRYNLDNFTDILWRNTTTGQNVIWYMQNRSVLPGSGSITSLADLNWNTASFSGASSLANIVTNPTFASIAGAWRPTSGIRDFSACPVNGTQFQWFSTFTITQSGTAITATNSDGASYTGTYNPTTRQGNLTGSGAYRGGTTTDSLTIGISSPTTMTLTGTYNWTDGTRACGSGAQITLVR